MLRDITLSDEMKEAYRLIRLEEMRKRQDALFERNMILRQKLAGIIICLSTIAGWWFFSQVYEQFELGLLVPPILFLGIYLIVTDTIIEKENR